MKKRLAKSLALLLALLMAFGVSAGAAGFPPPEDKTGLPALTPGVTEQGVIQDGDVFWYTFTPAQGGYYHFTVTGGYKTSDYNYFIIGAYGHVDNGDFVNWSVPWYEQGKTYCVRVYAIASSNAAMTSDNFTVTPRLYQEARPLTNSKMIFSKLEDVLKGSPYSVGDVEHWSIRGKRIAWSGSSIYSTGAGGTGHLDLYFSDGVYTAVEYGSPGLMDYYELLKNAYEAGGLSGAVKLVTGNITQWLGYLPLLPIFGIMLSFFFAPYSGLMTLFTLLPISILALPLSLIFLPFSLLNLFS